MTFRNKHHILINRKDQTAWHTTDCNRRPYAMMSCRLAVPSGLTSASEAALTGVIGGWSPWSRITAQVKHESKYISKY
jgi:hypothetical protein